MITQAQSRSDAEPSFCKRELEVLRLLAKEQSSQQIGHTLRIEKRTTEVYIQLITAKLRAVNGTHAVATRSVTRSFSSASARRVR